MSKLLIHSMSEFASFVLPALQTCNARRIVEIGAEHGGMSATLSQYCSDASGQLICIDPSPSKDFIEWLGTTSSVTHLACPSLEVIDAQSDIDAWFVDGDHNWFTVINELRAIRAACERSARPLLVFMHDVSWPCARRDSYYAPQRIPAEFCHPHSFDDGVTLDSSSVLHERGFRGLGQFAWAKQEGGERNGVLTAVEDFVSEQSDAGAEYAWACIPAVFGLGVLFDSRAPWADQLADQLAPWHNHPLLMALEENRLRNYLAVLDWQDRQNIG